MKAIPNTLFAFFLLITGLSVCEKDTPEAPEDISLRGQVQGI